MHFTHFNVPLAYRGRYVVTIHDLTHLLRQDIGASPRDPASRALKALPYRVVLHRAIKRAERVITVSNTTKQQIIDRFGVDPDGITVTYEGTSAILSTSTEDLLPKLGVRRPYLLYVGNAYPHKNLARLVEAFAWLEGDSTRAFQLVLAGSHGPYRAALVELARSLGVRERVVFLGRVTDPELAALYCDATAVVLVSFAEGFGLTGLEAMALGVPVVASRIDALREIYGDAAYFVDPDDTSDIARGLSDVARNPRLRAELRSRGVARSGLFSWRATAEATRRLYLDCVSVRPPALSVS